MVLYLYIEIKNYSFQKSFIINLYLLSFRFIPIFHNFNRINKY